jgi:uncharacterized protein HemY
MAFIVFLIIVVLTWFQRRLMDEDRVPWRTRRRLARAASLRQDSTRVAAGSVR